MAALKQKKFLLSFSLFFIILAFLFVPQFSSARGIVPCGGSGEKPCTVQDIFILIARAINYLIGVAGIYAVFQIVNAGFWLMVSSGDEEKIKKWRQGLSNAVVGFVVVLLAFVFINTAVNLLLAPKCKVDLTNPLSYLSCK